MAVNITVFAINLKYTSTSKKKKPLPSLLQKSQFCLPLLPNPSVWYQRRCNIINNTKIIPVINVQI